MLGACLSPVAYLRRRPIVYAAFRLSIFWLPATTSAEAFDIVARAPSGVPFLGPALTVLLVILASRAWVSALLPAARSLQPARAERGHRGQASVHP